MTTATPVTLEEIKRLVALQLGIKNIKDTDRFIEDLGAESFDVMTIIVAIDEKYSVFIKESEIPALKTPKDLYERVIR